MVSQAVKLGVLEKLKETYGSLYTAENVRCGLVGSITFMISYMNAHTPGMNLMTNNSMENGFVGRC